jgi:hypothetical protein
MVAIANAAAIASSAHRRREKKRSILQRIQKPDPLRQSPKVFRPVRNAKAQHL